MYIKLALGNVRRSLRDYSVYFATLALAACLLYSFIASGDYLLALDLTPDQRAIYAKSGTVLEGFSVFVVVIFIFLVAYANRFIVRRRKREFGLYALVGMPRHGVAAVLALEGLVVGAASLAAGIILGGLLSPVFSAIAAFVFDAPWRFQASFSPGAGTWTAGCFVAITALGAAACARDVLRRPLVDLMCAERAPEHLAFGTKRAARIQFIAALPLLAIVWGACVFQPMYFVVFIIPMGFAAFGATYLVMRSAAWRWGARARRHVEHRRRAFVRVRAYCRGGVHDLRGLCVQRGNARPWCAHRECKLACAHRIRGHLLRGGVFGYGSGDSRAAAAFGGGRRAAGIRNLARTGVRTRRGSGIAARAGAPVLCGASCGSPHSRRVRPCARGLSCAGAGKRVVCVGGGGRAWLHGCDYGCVLSHYLPRV